jgi:hypothetical protein
MGEVTIARGSSSLADLVKEVQDVLSNYGSSGLDLDASVEILSRIRLEENMDSWKDIPQEERPPKVSEYEGLLEDDTNQWFAAIQINS